MPEAQPSRDRGLGRASVLLASGTIVSRVLGFASATVLAFAIGTQGPAADAFNLANQLPNNIYAIIAGGILSAILVPQIVRANLHDDGGARFINRLVTLGLTIFIAAAVIATLAAPLLISLYAQQSTTAGRGFSSQQLALATAFAYWCLPQVLFYAIYSLLGEVLNARRVFGPFTWAPALNNVIAIAGLVAFSLLFPVYPRNASASAWSGQMIALVGGSATLGVAVQGLVLFLFWRRAGLGYRPDFHWKGVGLGAAGRAAAWTFGMILITQIAGVVQSNVASEASGSDNASVTVLRYSWLIFMLPHSIVAVSIATAYFTRMSGHARDGNVTALRGDLSSSLRRIGLMIVFATVALMVVAYPFSRIFTNDFSHVAGMANVVLAFLPGLIPFSALFIVQRTFYALEDTRTPFFVQLLQASVFVAGAFAVAPLPSEWIAVGIAAVTTIAGTVESIFAATLLRRRLGRVDARRVVRQHLLYLLAAAPAAAIGALVVVLLGGYSAPGFAVSGRIQAFICIAVVGAIMAVSYFAGLRLLKVDELHTFTAPVIARLKRKK